MDTKTKKTTYIAIAGAVIVLLILILGTVFMINSAKRDNESSVRSVSLLYESDLSDMAHLSKPVRPEALFDTLQSLIKC